MNLKCIEDDVLNDPTVHLLINIALSESRISSTGNALVYYDKYNRLEINYMGCWLEMNFRRFQSEAKLDTTEYNCVFVHRYRNKPPIIRIGYTQVVKYINNLLLNSERR